MDSRRRAHRRVARLEFTGDLGRRGKPKPRSPIAPKLVATELRTDHAGGRAERPVMLDVRAGEPRDRVGGRTRRPFSCFPTGPCTARPTDSIRARTLAARPRRLRPAGRAQCASQPVSAPTTSTSTRPIETDTHGWLRGTAQEPPPADSDAAVTERSAVLENEHVRLVFRRNDFGFGPAELFVVRTARRPAHPSLGCRVWPASCSTGPTAHVASTSF